MTRLIANINNLVYVGKKPCSSAMFLSAVAAGCVCLKSSWITDCFHYQSLLDKTRYILSNGVAEKFFLDGLRIQLNGSIEFKDKWYRIVRESGGKPVDRLLGSSATSDRVDICITEINEYTPNALVIEACKRIDIPLVSEQWLEDVILTKLEFDMENTEAIGLYSVL